jgi:hypothetical protein
VVDQGRQPAAPGDDQPHPTSILFGGDEANDNVRSGARLTLGAWLDPCQRAGIEVTYLGLGDSNQSANFNSTTTPVLAIPYTNALNGAPASFVVAYPNFSTGSIAVQSVSRFDTIEALLRRNLYQDCNAGMDFLLGYRYARLTDTVAMNVSSTGNGQASDPSATSSFNTDNNFNGVELGLNGQIRKCALPTARRPSAVPRRGTSQAS